MKKLFLLPVLVLLLMISCKKDAAKPDTPKTKEVTISVDASEENISDPVEIIKYADTIHLDYDKYNECTKENFHITGNVLLQGKWKIKNDTLDSWLRYRYDSMVGVGYTSGKTYTGHAFYYAYFRIPYPIVNDSFIKLRVISRILFKTAGPGNDMLSINNHTIRYEDNGTLKIEKITNEWSCR